MTTKTYGALNPEQLARLFEMRQEIAKRHNYEAEADVWAEAAYIVRNTEFVGWNDSMFKVQDGESKP